MSKFLPTSVFTWIDPKELERNKHTYELRGLRNDYLLAPYKTEIKRKMLFDHQLKIADLYNTPIGNVKKNST